MPEPAVLRIHLLGGFRVAVDGRPIAAAAWRQKRAAAIVKLLALEPAHRLHREQIQEVLWPGLDVEAGANNLRLALHRARRCLADAGAPPDSYLVRDGAALLLGDETTVWVDVDAFDAAAAHAWRTPDVAAAEAALSCYASDLLPEDPYDEWAERRRTSLRASYLALLARLARLAEQSADTERAIAAYQRILAVEPAQEETHSSLMRLLARAGRRTEALAQYQRLVTALENELAAAPEPTTLALHEAIRDNRFAGQDPAVESDVVVRRTNLPVQVDALIGRTRELAEVAQLLAIARLVTLTGPGGVGKTRLALAVAHQIAGSFPDGVCFVDLVSVRDPSLVAEAIARALGLHDAGGQPRIETLLAALRETQALLLLDNFEQVLEAAGLLADLVAGCPRLVVLTTSRTRLRLRGERDYPVLPLAIPATPGSVVAAAVAASPAGQLFAERAREARSDFALTPENAAAVAEICRRLDGLPLALELAAARVRILTPDELLSRLADPLTLLTGGARDLPERQRTIRAAIAWSYELLAPAEQAHFRRLAVFTGGWTLPAAEAVVDPVGELGVGILDGLASLVDQSLVVEQGLGGERRFALLETIREYAAAQLATAGELDAMRHRHAAYYLSRAEAEGPRLEELPWTPTLLAVRAEIAADLPNFRAADAWLRSQGDAEAALRLGVALRRFLHQTDTLREGGAWFERLLLIPGIERHPDLYLATVFEAASSADWQSNHALARTRFEQVLSVAREIGDRRLETEAFKQLAEIRLAQGEAAEAAPLLAEAEAMALELDDLFNAASAANYRGSAAFALGDFGEAVLHYERARGWFGAIGDFASVAATYAGAAIALARAGSPVQARAAFLQALDMSETEHADWTATYCLAGLAGLAVEQGDPAAAGRLYGAATASQEALGIPFSAAVQQAHDRWQARARAELGEERWATEIAAGRVLPLAEAVALARETR
jgi:predicted ATPase/DNA-binding SARP family transcriptional activator